MNNVTELRKGNLAHQPKKPRRTKRFLAAKAAAEAAAREAYDAAERELEGVPAPQLHAVPRRVWVHPVVQWRGVPSNYPGAVPLVLSPLQLRGAEIQLRDDGVIDTGDLAYLGQAGLWGD